MRKRDPHLFPQTHVKKGQFVVTAKENYDSIARRATKPSHPTPELPSLTAEFIRRYR